VATVGTVVATAIVSCMAVVAGMTADSGVGGTVVAGIAVITVVITVVIAGRVIGPWRRNGYGEWLRTENWWSDAVKGRWIPLVFFLDH